MSERWQNIIDRSAGTPALRRSGIAVSLVLGYLAAGSSAEDLIDQYPELTGEEIAACRDYLQALAQGTV